MEINISILVIAKYSVLLLAGTFYITKIVKTKREKFQIFGLKNHSEEWSWFIKSIFQLNQIFYLRAVLITLPHLCIQLCLTRNPIPV